MHFASPCSTVHARSTLQQTSHTRDAYKNSELARVKQIQGERRCKIAFPLSSNASAPPRRVARRRPSRRLALSNGVAGKAPPRASLRRRRRAGRAGEEERDEGDGGPAARSGRRCPNRLPSDGDGEQELPPLLSLGPHHDAEEQGTWRSRGGRAFFLSGGSRAAGRRRTARGAVPREPTRRPVSPPQTSRAEESPRPAQIRPWPARIRLRGTPWPGGARR